MLSSLSTDFREEFGPGSGLDGCDFKPHFDGWLLNAYRLTERQTIRETHMCLIWREVQEMAAWLLARREHFSPGDRFQLIVGWPEHVRQSARQIVKIGGGFDALTEIVEAESAEDYMQSSGHPVFRSGWERGIYNVTSD